MSIVWTSAAAEFAASVTALNAHALHRAGLLEVGESNAMHGLLDVLERAAATEEQQAIAQQLRKLLPPLPKSH